MSELARSSPESRAESLEPNEAQRAANHPLNSLSRRSTAEADHPSTLNSTAAAQPQWQATFPVRQSAEHAVSRRQFVKAACCSALAVGAAWAIRDRLRPLPTATEPKHVARVDDIAVGGYKLFRYPTEDQPCILVRLSETEFAAYSQSCTHLMCPINYRPEQKQFYCPCHEGYFSAEDGRVLAGPPPRPLPRYPVEIRKGEIWVTPAATSV